MTDRPDAPARPIDSPAVSETAYWRLSKADYEKAVLTEEWAAIDRYIAEYPDPRWFKRPWTYKTTRGSGRAAQREDAAAEIARALVIQALRELEHAGGVSEYTSQALEARISLNILLVANRASHVREALKAGKPVPPHVLADFPALAAQYPAAVAPAKT